jgi:hypothetical protein
MTLMAIAAQKLSIGDGAEIKGRQCVVVPGDGHMRPTEWSPT